MNFKKYFIEANEEPKENLKLNFGSYIFSLLRYIASSINTSYLGAILLRLNIVPLSTENPEDADLINQIWGSAGHATLAVDQHGNIFITHQFAKKIGQAKLIAVLCHEAMHIATYTFDRFETLPNSMKNHLLWNYISDAFINRDLRDIGHLVLPELAVIPDTNGILTFGDDTYNTIDKKAEDVYYEILSKVQQQQQQQQQQQPSPKISVGDIVYNKETNEYGKVTKITGKSYNVTPITEDEAEKSVLKN